MHALSGREKSDFPANVMEYDMRKTISFGMFATLVALLASANVFAAKGATPVYGKNHAGVKECNVTRDQTSDSACIKVKDIERRTSNANTAAAPGSPVTARVFLDDYQRLPQAVSKQHRTAPLVLGREKRPE